MVARINCEVWSLIEKMFLEISQNLQENTCAKVPLIKNLQASALNLMRLGFLRVVFYGG